MREAGPTLFALAMLAMPAALLIAATAVAFRRHGVRRLYWAGCAVLIGAGSAGTVGVICCAPPMIAGDGAIVAEMPPAFGVALMLAIAGCCGALLGLIGLACHRRGGAGGAGAK